MIDLGHDLDGYGDGDEPARPTRPGQPSPTPHPDGGGTYSLVDLQAAGFNIDHYAVQHAQAMQRHNDLIRHMLADPVEPPDLNVGPLASAPTVPGEPIFLGYRRWVGIEPSADTLPPWFKLHTDEGGPPDA